MFSILNWAVDFGHRECPCYSARLVQEVGRVKGEVELKDIDARFAEDAELARLSVLEYESAELGLGRVPLAGDARNLEFNGGGRDIGIEPGAGGGDQVKGNRSRLVLRLGFAYVSRFTNTIERRPLRS